jgi:hypothetical protein
MIRRALITYVSLTILGLCCLLALMLLLPGQAPKSPPTTCVCMPETTRIRCMAGNQPTLCAVGIAALKRCPCDGSVQ